MFPKEGAEKIFFSEFLIKLSRNDLFLLFFISSDLLILDLLKMLMALSFLKCFFSLLLARTLLLFI